ncbi:MAG TPA: ABC transporter ATP-binding protein [Fimbriimonadaceae bacterium]|nr:peptide ABC transporter ATP-binding protein [Armatimonadota bacterium]HCM74150.1 peptide ABC transporter ATP-binding protein [Armatimonadota bacterium]HRI74627.1 ABC transporter ATP-binding protein [Fimbriimonadaceae bacterium]
MQEPIVEVRDLNVSVRGTQILRGVNLTLHAGKTLGVVGESGCGKTMTGLTLMGMLPAGASIDGGSLRIGANDVTRFSESQWRGLRGATVSMIMQDPFTSLNPMMRVGDQIAEVMRLHRGLGKASAWSEAVEWLRKVGVPSPEKSARKFPHQMSGGQRQRVVIAAAFATQPQVIVADEPTTALDVTLQAQTLRLLRELQAEHGTAVMLITHDIGVVAAVADEVAVFYAGQVIENGTPSAVLHHPQHPYTQALLAAVPQPDLTRLITIPGSPPFFGQLPAGCSFAPRCPHAFEACHQEPPMVETPGGQRVTCWKAAKPVTPSV